MKIARTTLSMLQVQTDLAEACNGDKKISFEMLLLFGLVLILATHAVLIFSEKIPSFQGEFFGFDTYNRMTRAHELYQQGHWFNSGDPRISPPEGFVSHWSRPLDGLIVAGAFVLDMFMSPRSAVFWSGTLISPVLQMLSFTVALVFLRRCFSLEWLENVVIIFILSFAITQAFYIGRPDHHAPMLALLWIAVALLARILLTSSGPATWALLGITVSVMTWVVATGFLVACAISAAFGVLWCIYGCRYLSIGLITQLSLILGLTSSMVLERGLNFSDLTVIESDRISLLHVSLALLPLIFWLGAAVISKGWPLEKARHRIVVAVASALVIGLVLVIAFPDLRPSSVTNADPFYLAHRGHSIAEYQPLISVEKFREQGLFRFANVTRFSWVYFLGFSALIYLLIADISRRRPLWMALSILWLIPTVYFYPRYFGLQWAHMPMYTILMILPLCEVMHRILKRFENASAPWDSAGRIAFRLAIVAIPISTQITVALATPNNTSSLGTAEASGVRDPCYVGPAKAKLEAAFGTAEPLKLMALPELSGQLRYHLDAAVFAIGQHRRQPGFHRMYKTFASTDMAEVERRLQKFQVDGVLVCASPRIGPAYFRDMQSNDYLYARLKKGDVPEFLRQIPLDTTGLKAYRID